MNHSGMRPYALQAGEGWIYHSGIVFTVKAGELGQGRRLALLQYTTRRGEEPPEHIHPAEDEAFYILRGALTFWCGEDRFGVEEGGFIFLPRGIPHGYTIRSDGDVRLLVVTTPAPEDSAGGWGGFVGDLETNGERRATPPGRP